MKCLIKYSDFFYNGKLFPEGSEIDLPELEAKLFSGILFPAGFSDSVSTSRSDVETTPAYVSKLPKKRKK